MSLLWHKVASDPNRYWGAGDVDALFQGHPTRPAPFPLASQRKDRHTYDREAVQKALSGPPVLKEFDPRTLHTLQPSVTRAGVKHYMSGEHERTGETFADGHQTGNQHPFVYEREDGQNILLAGNHRATGKLLEGKPLLARSTEGSWPMRSG